MVEVDGVTNNCWLGVSVQIINYPSPEINFKNPTSIGDFFYEVEGNPFQNICVIFVHEKSKEIRAGVEFESHRSTQMLAIFGEVLENVHQICWIFMCLK